MKKKLSILGTLLLLAWGSSVQAASIELAEAWLNIDGATYQLGTPDPLPGGVDVGGFDLGTGLGSIKVTIGGATNHSIGLFVDHDIDETSDSFFNEFGATSVAGPEIGQSWEIDEPGWNPPYGDIYDNFLAGTLDGINGIPVTGDLNDVSMAMFMNFDLLTGETGLVTFNISETTPSLGFYLSQTNPDSQANIYFTGEFSARGGGGQVVPEPSTLLLLGAGLAGLGLFSRRRSNR